MRVMSQGERFRECRKMGAVLAERAAPRETKGGDFQAAFDIASPKT